MNRAARMAALSVLLLSGCEDPAARALEEARAASYRGDYARAKEILDASLVDLFTDHEERDSALKRKTLLLAGRITLLFLKEPRQALPYFERLAEEFPESDETFEARARMAEIYEQDLGDRRAAIAQWKALVASFPDRPETHRFQYEVVRALIALGDYGPAHTEARILETKFPKSEYIDDAAMLEGEALESLGRYREAIDRFQRVVEAGSPLAPRAKVEMAGCFESLGREEEALRLYLEALSEHPDPRIVQLKIERLQKRMRRGE